MPLESANKNDAVLERMFNQMLSETAEIRKDIKTLNSAISRVEVEVASFGISDLKATQHSQQVTIAELKAFRDKAIGAFFIMNGIWGIVAAVIIGIVLKAF